MPSPQTVVFLYARGFESIGSKIMRIDQMSTIIKDRIGDDFEIRSVQLPPSKRPRKQRDVIQSLEGSIVITLKNTLLKALPENREILADKARAILVDWVDIRPNPQSDPFVDLHIASSIAGMDRIRTHLETREDSVKPGAMLCHIRHNFDPRLNELSAVTKASHDLRMCYFGSPSSHYWPPELPEQIEQIPYDRHNITEGLRELASRHLQYCVRKERRKYIHPFTKGFTAAALGQNVLVNRQAPDVLHYLGDDYPYLVDDISSSSVQSGLEKVRETFRGSEWTRGLERMAHVKNECNEDRVFEDFNHAIGLALDITAPKM